MIDRLISLLSAPPASAPQERANAERIALAALLVEAAHADGQYLAVEQSAIDDILMARFAVSRADAAALRADGETARDDAADLVRFTRVVKDTVAYEERVAVIEAIWRVIYADGEREAHESALVRQLCGLLYIPDREAGLARQRVLTALGG
ncbi:MAG: TerB family tellurite resistance protein [Pseudomonadota bacterium]